MVSLQPRKLFTDQTEIAKEFGLMAHSTALHSAVTHAMFQYASFNPTQEQLSGVNTFLQIFLNLAEPEAEQPKFPDKARQLKHDTSNSAKPPEKKDKTK